MEVYVYAGEYKHERAMMVGVGFGRTTVTVTVLIPGYVGWGNQRRLIGGQT